MNNFYKFNFSLIAFFLLVQYSYSQCPGANSCDEIVAENILITETLTPFEFNYNCVGGCLDEATPIANLPEGLCSTFSENPTVWFKVEVDGSAEKMYSYVSTLEEWDPIWAVFKGDDCGSLQVVFSDDSLSCSNQDYTPDLHQIDVDPFALNYWIAVTFDQSSMISLDSLNNTDFSLCVSTTETPQSCTNQEVNDCKSASANFEIVSRSNGLAIDPDGDGVAGPFCPGETVSIQIEFLYDASNSGATWISGFVPVFGEGWDLTNFNYDLYSPVALGSESSWYASSGPCPTFIQDSSPTMCTFVKDNGELEFCNMQCSPCEDCSTPLQSEDLLPSGYFWVTNGGSAGCENNCSPSEGWGLSTSNTVVTWNLDLTVGIPTASNKASDDLSISIQVFSDDLTGCWVDPETPPCVLDKAIFGPQWKSTDDNVSSVLTFEGPSQVCSGEPINLLISNPDTTGKTILVSYLGNELVTGGNDHFVIDSFIINDILFNNSDTTETVYYSAIIIEDGICGQESIFELEVLPNNHYFVENQAICVDTCMLFHPVKPEFQDQIDSYIWQQGSTDSAIEVCPSDSVVYVQIVDTLGCTFDKLFFITSGTITNIDTVICPGSSFQSYDVSGTYIEEIEDSLSSCTNLQVLNLLVLPEDHPDYYSVFDTTICEGMSYLDYDSTGTYFQITQDSIQGCVYTLEINLTVLPSSHPDCTSSTDETLAKSIDIFPNPSQDFITIKSEYLLEEIKIFDSSGKLALNLTSSSNQKSINVSSLNKGVYIARIQTVNGLATKKIIIN